MAEENLWGTTTRHWLWRVKDIPCMAWSRTQAATVKAQNYVVVARIESVKQGATKFHDMYVSIAKA